MNRFAKKAAKKRTKRAGLKLLEGGAGKPATPAIEELVEAGRKILALSAPLAEELAKPIEALTPSTLPAGLHQGISPNVYYTKELGVASNSALNLVRRAPALYRAWLDEPEEEPTPALAFGTAFHMGALEPERYVQQYAVAPEFGDCRKAGPRDARDAWRAQHLGKKWLTATDGAAIAGMLASLRAHPIAGPLLAHPRGVRELTLRWDDREHGIPCKGRADWYVDQLAVTADLKSTLDASLDVFRRDIVSHGYHRQDAFYRDGFAELGAELRAFLYVAVEKTPPYLVSVFTLELGALVHGERQIRRAMACFADCLAKNVWPGYPEAIQEIDLPRWAGD